MWFSCAWGQSKASWCLVSGRKEEGACQLRGGHGSFEIDGAFLIGEGAALSRYASWAWWMVFVNNVRSLSSSNYMVWKTNKQTNTVHFSLHSGNLTRHRAISFAEVTDPAVTTDARGSEGETQPTRRTK